ncbi:hypothetical protein AGR1B_pa0011 [Agrobacterium fabacearum S56]|nr:hypothetical protein AGR1B_pa0011 [Agrobacterium fabacearum S56]
MLEQPLFSGCSSNMARANKEHIRQAQSQSLHNTNAETYLENRTT